MTDEKKDQKEQQALPEGPPTQIVARADLASGIVPTAQPNEHLRPGEALGAEDIDAASVQVARVNVVQKTSTFAEDLGAEYGELWHSLKDVKLWPVEGLHYDWPEELAAFAEGVGTIQVAIPKAVASVPVLPLVIVPVYCYRDRLMFRERDLVCASQRGGVLTRAGFVSPVTGVGRCLPGEGYAGCPLRLWRRDAEKDEQWDDEVIEEHWGKDDEAPPCTEQINVLSLTVGPQTEVDIVALSFARTSAKQGREFEALLKGSTYPVWAHMYGIWVLEEENEKGKYAVLRKRQIPGWTPESLVQMAEAKYGEFKNIEFETHADTRAADFGNGEGPAKDGDAPDAPPAAGSTDDDDPFGY